MTAQQPVEKNKVLMLGRWVDLVSSKARLKMGFFCGI